MTINQHSNTDSDKKIFCIGFNKTGTTSLHNFFISCGFTSTHNTEWCYFSHIHTGKNYFKNQCYTDGEKSHFVQLENWFPHALFILNTRDARSWLYSRIKHVMRHNLQLDLATILSAPKHGKMAKDFFANESAAIRNWLLNRSIYHQQARTFFDNNPRFFEIDITQTKEWTKKLSTFIVSNGMKITESQTVKNIHINKRDKNDLLNQQTLNNYFRLADQILKQESQTLL